MDTRSLCAIEAAFAFIEMEELDRPWVFEMAAATADEKRACLTCTGTVSVDTGSKIRYGSVLVLRNLKWLVTVQRVADPRLGRSVLKGSGLDTRELLVAVAYWFAGSIYIELLIGTLYEKGNSRASRVMEGVFHADGLKKPEEDGKGQEEWCGHGLWGRRRVIESPLRQPCANESQRNVNYRAYGVRATLASSPRHCAPTL